MIAEVDEETFRLISAPLPNYGVSVTVVHYNPYRDCHVIVTYDSGRERSIIVQSLGESPQKHI